MSDTNFLRLARRVRDAEEAVGRYLSGGAISVGSGVRLADRNIANTMFVEGQQNSDRGYINFSQTSGNALGAVNGGNLTWRGSRVWDAAAIPYETGTWTPALYGATTPGSPVYASLWGIYRRIGNVVHVMGRVSISSKGGMEGALRIGGLPFVSNMVAGGSIGAISYASLLPITLHLDGGTNFIQLVYPEALLTDINIGDAFALWGFSLTYSTA